MVLGGRIGFIRSELFPDEGGMNMLVAILDMLIYSLIGVVAVPIILALLASSGLFPSFSLFGFSFASLPNRNVSSAVLLDSDGRLYPVAAARPLATANINDLEPDIPPFTVLPALETKSAASMQYKQA
jgi:hypothetical protein